MSEPERRVVRATLAAMTSMRKAGPGDGRTDDRPGPRRIALVRQALRDGASPTSSGARRSDAAA